MRYQYARLFTETLMMSVQRYADIGTTPAHIWWIPVAFTTFVHFSMSALINAANSSGEFATTSRPSAASLSLMCVARSMAVASRCSQAMISCGVPAGANRPYLSSKV